MKPDYACDGVYDEFFQATSQPRYPDLAHSLDIMTPGSLKKRQQTAEELLHERGITFAVYGHSDGNEKIWPFDVLPRVITASDWDVMNRGLMQRIRALNLFLDDVYSDGKIMKDGIVPADLVYSAKTFRKQCMGFRPPQGVWTHITGTDLIRHTDGQIYVLEDNLRCPSGVSYVLANRDLMKFVVPEIFSGTSIAPVEEYPERLLETLQQTAPDHCSEDGPVCVLLTPGIYNSAYFEHCFLAQQMGIELVTGPDLVIDGGFVMMRTTHGLKRVDVIYRRIDDDFIDPKAFRPDSALGVSGLMEVYRNGNVTIANAPGTGVADDKAVYAYVPRIIQYYLSEEAILPNVPTYLCSEPDSMKYVLEHLEELVVKPTNESGGYGILMGPMSTAAEREKTAAEVKANPRNFIAQPMLNLSTVPTIAGDDVRPRHVDLRPFILYGKDFYILPGGLTRVALKEGSMIVNSSQGGGSKDTWVLT